MHLNEGMKMSKYHSNWQGLDQGGEQTWRPDVIEGVAKEIGRLGIAPHTDPESPLFGRLRDLFPHITWVSRGSDGSSRTIFRRSNTWARLGLVDASGGRMRLTPLGESFVIGEITVREVLVNALANHEEENERPFSILATAILEKPRKVWTLEDFEFGVMGNYRPGEDNLDTALSSPHGSFTDTRKRRIRAMLSRLEDVDAVTHSDSGWTLKDINALSEISGRALRTRIASDIIVAETRIPVEAEPTRQATDFSIAGREYRESIPTFNPTGSASTPDPQKRRELLEKASLGHAYLLKALASLIKTQGLIPTEDPSSYDMAVINGDEAWIFEAKTCTESNVKDQIRKAIVQLYEYRWRGRALWPQTVNLVIVLDKAPLSLIEGWVLEFLYNDRGIKLAWYEEGSFKIYNFDTSTSDNFVL